MGDNPQGGKRRDESDIWRIERDAEKQEALLSKGGLRIQGYRSVDELLAFFLLLREAGSGLNTPVFGLVIHSVRPGGMGFIPGV